MGTELKDSLQFLFNLLGKLEGIQGVAQLLELGDFGRDGLFRGTDALEGSLGRIIDPFQLRADPNLASQFHRGEEQVLKQPQLVAVEIVQGLQSGGRIVAFVA